jgi:hypothetical protein
LPYHPHIGRQLGRLARKPLKSARPKSRCGKEKSLAVKKEASGEQIETALLVSRSMSKKKLLQRPLMGQLFDPRGQESAATDLLFHRQIFEPFSLFPMAKDKCLAGISRSAKEAPLAPLGIQLEAESTEA